MTDATDFTHDIDVLLRLTKDQQAEIRHLKDYAEAYFNECLSLKADIARLRKQCEGLAQSALNNGQDLLLKESEIECLRSEIECLRQSRAQIRAEMKEECARVVDGITDFPDAALALFHAANAIRALKDKA